MLYQAGDATVFLDDIVTGPRADPFVGISVAVNLNDEAKMESDPVKVISDDSGSDAVDIDIDIEH